MRPITIIPHGRRGFHAVRSLLRRAGVRWFQKEYVSRRAMRDQFGFTGRMGKGHFVIMDPSYRQNDVIRGAFWRAINSGRRPPFTIGN